MFSLTEDMRTGESITEYGLAKKDRDKYILQVEGSKCLKFPNEGCGGNSFKTEVHIFPNIKET